MGNYGNIVKGVRERKTQSQMMFYDRFVLAVYRSAFSIVGNESEAEEIAQDTMLKVFGRLDLLNDDAGEMERILRRIATNAAIDVMRRRKDFIFSVEEILDFEDLEEEDDSRDFSVEEIREAVATLPDAYRNILSLRLFEDMSFAEIAGLLAINGSTARVQYTRGISKLKNLLNKKK
jgi:RNA polymerase sigma-70 factor (ECF subfamily)